MITHNKHDIWSPKSVRTLRIVKILVCALVLALLLIVIYDANGGLGVF